MTKCIVRPSCEERLRRLGFLTRKLMNRGLIEVFRIMNEIQMVTQKFPITSSCSIRTKGLQMKLKGNTFKTDKSKYS